jgi:nucleoside-diphosphate-sugar epimerase
MALEVLFIGGSGNISLPCVEAAAKAGHHVTVFNQGGSGAPPTPGLASIVGDMKDEAAYRKLGDAGFDVVCQFIAFTSEQIAKDIETFSRVGQYIFISSASIYEKPPRHPVITEKTPTVNPYWTYSQNKITCEGMLKATKKIAWTIVRPSHTVRTMLPTMFNEGDIVARRMLEGRPVLVCGDGSTPWTLTRCEDFARPFVRLFGKDAALGECFHITSDNAYTWDDIYKTVAAGLGVEADIVHVPTDTLIRYHPEWEGPLMGDKTWAALFDNEKVKTVAGDFETEKELRNVLAQPLAHVKTRLNAKGSKDDDLSHLMDRIAQEQRSLGRSTG